MVDNTSLRKGHSSGIILVALIHQIKISENSEVESLQIDLLSAYFQVNKQVYSDSPFPVGYAEIKIGRVWGAINAVYT